MLSVAAVTCPKCQRHGVLVLGFGPNATAEDSDILKALKDYRHDDLLTGNSAPGEAARDPPTTRPTPANDDRMRIWPGSPLPLGATFDGVGTNIAVFSEVAEAVELCLFDDDGERRHGSSCPSGRASVWHGYFPDLGADTPYGFRVHGPWDPAQRPALQPGQAAARPVRPGDRGHVRLGSGAVLLRFDDHDEHRHAPTARRSTREASSSTRSSTGDRSAACCCRGPRRSSTRRT